TRADLCRSIRREGVSLLLSNSVRQKAFSSRHCEERSGRSNPLCVVSGLLRGACHRAHSREPLARNDIPKSLISSRSYASGAIVPGLAALFLYEVNAFNAH